MTDESFTESLFSFISSAPTPFHAAASMSRVLAQHGFIRLAEGEPWRLLPGGRYVVIRNGALIAFQLGSSSELSDGFRIVGCHGDSPCLQVKPRPRTDSNGLFVARVERYGGALLHTWFDRELSLAGRVVCQSKDGDIYNLLVDFKRAVATIPSVAIHLNRDANTKQEINVHSEMCPIFGLSRSTDANPLEELLITQVDAQHRDIGCEKIHAFDLFFYDPQKPGFLGSADELICAPRLDNLLSCFIGLRAICQCEPQINTMLLCTNHEEIGSTSTSGALGNFTETVFARLTDSSDTRFRCLHNSYLLSLDNAHATHPNYQDKTDKDHPVVLNRGPVIKINASQRYASNANSSALFRLLCEEKGIPTQDFVMRGDMASGSTIGPLSAAKLGVETVDVGAPTWGMHAIREITGAHDPELLFEAVLHFFKRLHLPDVVAREA